MMVCQIEGPPILVPIIRASEDFQETSFLGRAVNIFGKMSIFHSDPHPGLDQNWAHKAYCQLSLVFFS
jgi:hypothetical protein